MSLLAILYWVLLVVGLVVSFVPSDIWPRAYIPSLIWIILFVLIGLKVFRTPLQ